MFIKRCARIYKQNKYESFWLVSSYRNKKGQTRHKYIANITNLAPSLREKMGKLFKNPNSLVIGEKTKFFESGYDYGDIVFFLYIMHQMGLLKILQKGLSKKALSLIVGVLLNRIIKPSSKMEAISWIKETAFVHFVSLKEKDYDANRVYEAMDEVGENLEGIMDDFYSLSLQKPVFLLYDISSVYFEGERVKIAKRGYSRDKRSDRPQVLLGLVLILLRQINEIYLYQSNNFIKHLAI
jgi:hypothetical protein